MYVYNIRMQGGGEDGTPDEKSERRSVLPSAGAAPCFCIANDTARRTG